MSGPDALVTGYLQRLEHAAAGLPPDRRNELLEGIAEHITSASATDESEVRTLLDRLGEPEEIVAAAREDLPPWPPGAGWGPPAMVPPPRGTGNELAAVLMLTLGSFLPVVGWLVGVVLLWTSSLWRVREKVLGTLVVPLGPGGVLLLGAFLPLFGSGEYCETVSTGSVTFGDPGLRPPPAPLVGGETVTCTSSAVVGGWAGVALLVVLLLAPLVVAVLLLRTARRRAAAHPVLVPSYGPAPSASPWGGLEIAGVLVLGLGGLLIPVVGPLVGLALVLASPRWTRTNKLVAAALCAVPVLVPCTLIALRVLTDRSVL